MLLSLFLSEAKLKNSDQNKQQHIFFYIRSLYIFAAQHWLRHVHIFYQNYQWFIYFSGIKPLCTPCKHLRLNRQWSKNCSESWQLAGYHSRDNSLSTSSCTPVDTLVIIHALLDHVDGCVRPTRPHSLCVPHEEVQKLSLDCLSADLFWNAQQ